MLLLRIGVLLSFCFALVSLAILIFKTGSFGKKTQFSEPGGSGGKGVLYALGQGMLPWEKESAARHLPTYLTGIGYHLGIFSALISLFLHVFSARIPGSLTYFFRFMAVLGFLCGLALLAKRVVLPVMRKISCPDDFAANIVVTLFLAFSFLHTFDERLAPFLFLISILLFLYAPTGKIRHCFFFFYSRILFGFYYGRRGVFPPSFHRD